MTVDIATLAIRIDSSEARTARRDLDGIATSGSRAEQAVKAMAAIFATIKAAESLVNTQRAFDKLNSSLITATGSTQRAAQAFGVLQSFAALTPYGLQEVTKAFVQLRNLGLTPSERALNSYGNTASAMGKSLNQMVEAVADAATGEFERLKEFGIKARQNGDRVSLTFQGVTSNIRNNAESIEKYLIELGETKFAGGMELQAKSLDGAISNLGDTWDATKRKFNEGGFGDAAHASTLALTAALTDLGAILDVVSGKAADEGKAVKEASLLHESLTTAFEAVAVLGVNVAYVFEQVGRELGGLAAQAAAVATGDFALAKRIGEAMKVDAEAARLAVDAKTEAILSASAKARKAAEDEAAANKAAGQDRLAEFAVVTDGMNQLTDAQKKEAEAYRDLIAPLREKAAASAYEIATGKAMTESQKAMIKLDEDIKAGKIKLTEEHLKEVRALIASTGEQDKWLISAANTKAAVQALDDERLSAYASAAAEAKANEELVKAFGKTKAQVEELTVARLEDRLAQRGALELSEKEVAQLERMIEVKRRNVASLKQLDALDTGSDLTKAKELLDILTAVDAATRQAAQGMEESFGRVGAAIGGLTTALSGYAVQQQAIAAQLAAVKADPKNSAQKIAQAEIAASKASAQAQIKSYGDMAGAAKGFFKEHTAGYKVMEGAEKAFRAYEMAMAIEAMVKKIFFKEAEVAANVTGNATKLTSEATTTAASTTLAGTEASAWGVTAVVKALASLPFPLNLAAGAATLAAVVGIGAKIMGGLGGGGGNTTSQDRQKLAGTGSVFGDTKAKSDSIAKSIELVAANSNIELSYTRGMLTSLRNIENSISGLANLLIRTTDLSGKVAGDTKSFDSKLVSGVGAAAGGLGGAALGTYLGMGMAAIGGPLGLAIGAVVGTLLGKTFVGKALSSVFGGSKSVTDTGLVVAPTNIGSIKTGGVNSSQYTDVKTDGGWFHSDKHSTQLTGLGAEANDQFTKVIVGLTNTITEAGKLLGLGGDEFTARLNSFVVDIGKVSLKGLSGEEIQKELETIFSKLGDDMAKFAVDGLAQFQKVGEGYFETLTRVASNYANLDSILMAIGTTFGATGVASIAARERLIDLAGGIDKLADQAAGFADNFLTEAERQAPVKKYVADQLASMGLASIDTRDEFKALVLGLDLTSEAGAKQYAQLMALADAFAKVYPAIENTTKSAEDLRQQLQDAYDAESDAISANIDRHLAYAASLRRFQGSLLLGDLSPLTPQQRYLEAKSQYDRTLALAKGGDENAQSNLEASATAFLKASQLVNASGAQYQLDFAQVQASTSDALRWAQQEVDVGRASLAALDRQVSGLIEVKAEVVSVAEAIRQLYPLLNAQQQAQVNANGTAAIESLYQSLLGRKSDAAGMAYWQQALAGGMSIGDMAEMFANSAEYQGKNAGNSTDAIESLYQRLLGRGSDPAGLEFWKQSLAGGVSLAEMATQFTKSAEYQARLVEAFSPAAVAENRAAQAAPIVQLGVDLRQYGTQNTEALVTAIRDLREQNVALTTEIKQLRTEQQRQTGDEIQANYDASARGAAVIAESVTSAIRAVSEKRVEPV